MESFLQLEMIPTPLHVPTAHQQLKATQEPRPALPPHAASLRAVRKPAMKPGRRHEAVPLFRVYRADPREFRHLVQRLTGAPQPSQAAQKTSKRAAAAAAALPPPPPAALDATPVTRSPPYHDSSLQFQGDDDMVSIASSIQLNLEPYMLQNVPSELTFDHDVVTRWDGGSLVRQVDGYGAVPSTQAAMVGCSEAAEFWLTALYPESTVWSSFSTIMSPGAVASMSNI